MTTFSQHHLARLHAADLARRNREMREEVERRRELRRSETGDFAIGLLCGAGISVMLWLIVWSWVVG
jgi:xanthine/CO dehydrogenase XdhC/CoxF family maturation factor